MSQLYEADRIVIDNDLSTIYQIWYYLDDYIGFYRNKDSYIVGRFTNDGEFLDEMHILASDIYGYIDESPSFFSEKQILERIEARNKRV